MLQEVRTIDHKYLEEVRSSALSQAREHDRELTEVARLELLSQRHCDAV